MDKKMILNNEIVKCRPIVRKVKVRVTRNRIKQIRLIKGSKRKDDSNYAKKLAKADRYLREVVVMKRIKEDEVTKFALQPHSLVIANLDNDRARSIAILANQEEVKEKIAKIKDLLGADDVPELLKTLGTRSMLKKYRLINKGVNIAEIKARKLALYREATATSSTQPESTEPASDSEGQLDINAALARSYQRERIRRVRERMALPSSVRRSSLKANVSTMPDALIASLEEFTSEEETLDEPEVQKAESKVLIREPSPVKEVKVDDPFFMGKKVAVPKLLLDEVQGDTTKEIKFSRDEDEPWRKNRRFAENRTDRFDGPGPSKRDMPAKFERKTQDAPERAPEKLHPSWAAKRQAQTIKPFEGKKITFNDD